MSKSKVGHHQLGNWKRTNLMKKPPVSYLKTRSEKQIFDFRRLVVDFGLNLAKKLERKGLFLAIRISPDTERFFYGVPQRIIDLLGNISSHAEHYTDEGGIVIDIDSELSGEGQHSILFSVTATGLGIPAEHFHLIFQLCRSDESVQNIQTAPSLHNAKRLARKMGGDILVHNTFGYGVRYNANVKITLASEEFDH